MPASSLRDPKIFLSFCHRFQRSSRMSASDTSHQTVTFLPSLSRSANVRQISIHKLPQILSDTDMFSMSFFCGLRTLVFTSLLCFATINSGAEAIEKSVSELTIHPLRQGGDRDSYQWQHKCPMVGPLIPETNEELLKMEILLASPDFLEASALRMSQAVRINTTSVDGMQSLNGNDHAWDHMSAFSRFLEKAFRLVHQKLKLQRINKHGLVYTWQGTDSSLKPVILLAHQDVVPANAEAENWKYPPFEGHWDGTYIWGRGATDCKNTLVASLEAVEELIRAKFIPKRTIILAYGFDEEISGYQGAKNIVKHLLDIYGDKGIAVVIDEGPGIMRSWSGSIAAFPAVAEKGYVDVEISVNMQTGHSSMPPSENSITVMADIVKLLHEHQYSVALDEDNPVSQTIFCAAQNDVNMKDGEWQMVVMADQGSISLNHLAAQITRQHPQVAGFFGTTQSIGMIHGGWKVNVVPGHTKVLINHRVGCRLVFGPFKGLTIEIKLRTDKCRTLRLSTVAQ